MSDKISVITAVYNGEMYLRETILSIESQTHKNFEYIVVNDCSTDKTLSILQEYPWIHVINNVSNLGQYRSLNVALQHCTGNLITYINADDTFATKDALEIIVRNYEKEPLVDFIYWKCDYIDDQGDTLYQPINHAQPFNRFVFLYLGTFIAHFAFSRGLLHRGFYFDDRFKYSADAEFLLRAIKADAKFKFIPDILTCFRIHPHSQSIFTSQARLNEDFKQVCDIYGVNLNVRLFFAYGFMRALRFLVLLVTGKWRLLFDRSVVLFRNLIGRQK